MATTSKRFVDNLGKIYGGYAGGFIGFVIILAIMEQMGVSQKVIGYCFVFLTIGVYAYIGILSRTSELSEYYVAGRVVPPFFNGMATGADWMSAASFISMAGGLYLAGYGGLGYVLGWTGGYVLVGVLLAPYLRCPTSWACATKATPRGSAAWSCSSAPPSPTSWRRPSASASSPRASSTFRSTSRSSSACSASWCARCSAGCGR